MTTSRTRKTASSSDSGTKSASKSPAKKTAAEKSPAKKSPAKKTPAKKTEDSSSTTSRRASAPRAESKPRPSATRVAQAAREQLTQLTGKATEAVTGVERNDDGWRVTVEVLEVRRIPETTDVLAQYAVDTDDNGDLTAYHRVGRYTRGSAREG